MKKNYSQTEAGKRYFIKMYKQAVANKREISVSAFLNVITHMESIGI